MRRLGYYPDEFAVARRLGGTVTLHYGSDTIDTSGPYLRPKGQSLSASRTPVPSSSSCSPRSSESLPITIWRAPDGSWSHPTTALSKPSSQGARLWNATADLIAEDDGSSPIRANVLRGLVISTVLITFPLAPEIAPASGVDVLPRAIRRATDYIDENLARPISVIQIAEAARISERALQYGFRREFGLTPHGYLHEARLRQVHTDLRDTDRAQTTVSAVAHRWGINHRGASPPSIAKSSERIPRTHSATDAECLNLPVCDHK